MRLFGVPKLLVEGFVLIGIRDVEAEDEIVEAGDSFPAKGDLWQDSQERCNEKLLASQPCTHPR